MAGRVSEDADALREELLHAEGTPSTLIVATLMDERKEDLAALKAVLGDSLPKDDPANSWVKYDDLFLLRFLLSFGSVKSAEKACRMCITRRLTDEHQAITRMVTTGEFETHRLTRLVRSFQAAGPLMNPCGLKSGGSTLLVRAGISDLNGQHATMTHDETLFMYLAFRENAYMHCDKMTRETGVITKQVFFMDLNGSRLSDMMDPRMSKIHKSISTVAAYLYPQLQDKMVILNAPSWITIVMSIMKRIMPKHMMDKLLVFGNPDDMWASDWAKENLNREGFPDFLGGTLKEVPDFLTGELVTRDKSDLEEVVVPARDSVKLTVNVPMAGTIVRGRINMQSYGIKLGAVLEHGAGDGPIDSVKMTGEKTVLRAVDSDGGGEKIKADTGLEKLEWSCPAPGTLVITLDNSYSLLRSKTVNYKFDIDTEDAAKRAGGAAAGAGAGAPRGALAFFDKPESGAAAGSGSAMMGVGPGLIGLSLLSAEAEATRDVAAHTAAPAPAPAANGDASAAASEPSSETPPSTA